MLGRVAVVTGAASASGTATALELARHGFDLALSDRSEAGMSSAAEAARAYGRMVTTHVVDVADSDELTSFADAVARAHGRINVVVNDAGVVVLGDSSTVAAVRTLVGPRAA
jgi:NAD(P)-dependent dehydrogenase (short-subunit alcohol dehydrogenase family)